MNEAKKHWSFFILFYDSIKQTTVSTLGVVILITKNKVSIVLILNIV